MGSPLKSHCKENCNIQILEVNNFQKDNNIEDSAKESTSNKDSLTEKFNIDFKDSAPITSNCQIIESFEQDIGKERKKKCKPDQLIFIKTLLTINFFGLVIILLHLLFIYIRLIFLFKNRSSDIQILVIVTIFEVLNDILYIISWTLFFFSALKRKLRYLKMSVIFTWISTLFKVISFIIVMNQFGEESGNMGLLVASCIYIIFQIFSIWSYSHVSRKMINMPEKNWKKAFRRPKGKYMYSQE